MGCSTENRNRVKILSQSQKAFQQLSATERNLSKMSSINKKSELGQVWTPPWLVSYMLDLVGYSGEAILDKTIMEPSFGAGAFLEEIVRRIAVQAHSRNLSKLATADIIDSNVVGIELDPEAHNATVERLSTMLKEDFGISVKLPNLVCGDTLDWAKPVSKAVETSGTLFEGFALFENESDNTTVAENDSENSNNSVENSNKTTSFDFVVGNPPYIRIHELSPAMRERIRTFASSTGISDLYVIFIELGLSMLSENGKLAFVTPNSWMKNVSQKQLRRMLCEQRLIENLIDFGSQQVFRDASTYASVFVLRSPASTHPKHNSSSPANLPEHFTFTKVRKLPSVQAIPAIPEAEFTREVFYTEFFSPGVPLSISPTPPIASTKSARTFADICSVQNGLLSMLNKVFLVTDLPELHDSPLVRPVVKSSRYRGGDITERILFPYRLDEDSNKVVGLTEQELREHPEVFQHFSNHREALEARDADKNALWFWFGRSQSLQKNL